MNGSSTELSDLIGRLNPLGRVVITVNLEGSSLRMTASRGRRILGWLDMPFNPQLVADGQVASPQEMAVVLRNALKRLGYAPSTVRAAYSGSRAIVRLVTLPRTPGVRPAAVLEREARRLLGQGVDQNHVFWHRLSIQPAELRYLLVAISRQFLNNYLDALILSRLRPAFVELKGLALARAVNQPRSLTVSVELTSVSTTLVEGFVPELVSHSPLDETVTFAEEDLGLQLVEEVRAGVEFFQQRFPTIPLSSLPVHLSGGHPLLDSPRLASMLNEGLGITVASLPQPNFSYDERLPVSSFLVNFGLLLADA